jgi:hypothetical protein
MARQTINIGSAPNDGTGDALRVAFDKINDNFLEVYDDGGANITVNNPVTSTETTLDVALSDLVGGGGATPTLAEVLNVGGREIKIVYASAGDYTVLESDKNKSIVLLGDENMYINYDISLFSLGDEIQISNFVDGIVVILPTGGSSSYSTLIVDNKATAYILTTDVDTCIINYRTSRAAQRLADVLDVGGRYVNDQTGTSSFTFNVSNKAIIVEIGNDTLAQELVIIDSELEVGDVLIAKNIIPSTFEAFFDATASGIATIPDLPIFTVAYGETLEITKLEPNLLSIQKYSYQSGGGATDLAYTPSPTNGIVTSSTGTDATLPLADATDAGLLQPADFTQLSTLATDLANINTDAVDKVTVKLALGISKGQAVYISSATGTNIIVSKASNTSEATSSKTLGLLATTGVTNDIVEVVTSGLLDGLDTSTATVGDPVWLGTSGNLIYGLASKPVAPAHLVYIGVVSRVHATVGEIFVRVQNGFELKEIHDVLITSVADKQVLSYDSASSLWKNKTIATTDDILFQDITINMPSNGLTTVNNVVGTALTLSGTPSIRTITDTNLFTRTTRVALETTIVPANVFGFRQVVGYFSINSGFKASFKFGASTGATNTNVRYSIGVFVANFIVTNVDPTTFINCMAFARIDGNNNWQFIHNDNTGTATAIDLGASFPANVVSTDMYYGVIETVSGNIKYTLTRLNTGDTVTGTVTTNLVSASTLLGMSAGCSNNLNAAICALDFGGMQLTKFT